MFQTLKMLQILQFFFLISINEIFAQSHFLISSEYSLKIYWNIPTFQCRPFNLNFTELSAKYGIIQNENDDFHGNSITILYDPGEFPEIPNSTYSRNGGIPQDANLTQHLLKFEKSVNNSIPNPNFDGLAIIDFESWRPIFRQNFGLLSVYKDKSIEFETKRHPFWSSDRIKKEAKRRFENSARIFMETTIKLGRKLRPLARWGYYAYPYCFNKSPSNMNENCPKEVQDENNKLYWLFSESNLLLPSIYLQQKLSGKDKVELIRGRIQEAQRIISTVLKPRQNPSIFPYFWYKYQDSRQFLSKDDLKQAFQLLAKSEIPGFVIWGSSNDVNSKFNCLKMYNYLDNILGPILINSISI